MDPELEDVEWHDAQLKRIVRDGDQVRLEFTDVPIYRKLAPELYDEERAAAILVFRNASVDVDPPGDERTTVDSRWVIDCTHSEPVQWYDIQSWGRGVGPGQMHFVMQDNSTLVAVFQSAQLTLVGPLRKVRKYHGPVRPPAAAEPETG